MKCPKCQKESLIGAEYCVRCGARLVGGLDGRGQPLSEVDGLPEVKRHLNEMAVRLSKVEGRVTLISERMNLEPSQPQLEISAAEVVSQPEPWTQVAAESLPAEVVTPEAPAPLPIIVEPITVQEIRSSELQAEVGAEAPSTEKMVPAKPALDKLDIAGPTPIKRAPGQGAESAPVSARPPKTPPKPPQPSRLAKRMGDWEQALPGNWLSRIGILALFIGLGFLAKLAYDRGWVNEVAQLLVGLACGGLLLLAGHHWRKVYRAWAQALTGGGIGVLYLSIFASYALNDLMPFWATFLLMFLVTILAVGIALRRDSMSIAIIGIAGAFLVPITLGAIDQSAGHNGSGGNNTGLLIAYVLTLDVGVVWLASLRNWRWFTLLGFGGSLAIFGLWYCTSDPDGLLGPAQGMLTGIFICFAAATTLFHGLWRRRPELTDLALMTLNAAVYFGVSHYLLWEEFRGWLGGLGFLLAGFYGLLGYIVLRRSKDNWLLSAFAFGIAITFLTVAIPVQLEKSYMTAAWAAEGAVLIWLAVRYGTPRWQLWGLGAFALVLIRLFAFDEFVDRAHFTPIMNDMFWAFAPSVVALYAAAYFLRHKEKALQPWFFPMMMLLANFLTIWLLSSEIVNYAGSRIMAALGNGAVGQDIRNLENARNLSLVALWAVYGFALMFAGARKGWLWLRLGGYALILMVAGTTVVELNYVHAMVRNGISIPIVNYSFASLTVCVCVLCLVASVVRKYSDKMTDAETGAFPILVSIANILTIYGLSSEVFTFLSESWDVRNLVLVALWATYGLGVMVLGLWKGWGWLRAQGLLLSLMAIGMTMMTLNYGHLFMREAPLHPIANYSFAAFALCISVVSALAYLIAGNRHRLHAAETSLFPALVLLANFLSLWALSSEVLIFIRDSENVRNLVLVALWCTYGFGLLTVGIRRNWDWLRIGGYVVTLVACGATLVLLNHSHAMIQSGTSWPILNYSFGGFAICIVALYLHAFAIARNEEKLHDFEKLVCIVALGSASVLTLLAFSAEIVTFLDQSENLRNLMLVILWTGYASLLMAVGVARKALLPRLGACALMVIAVGATGILLNHWQAGIQLGISRPIINYSFGGFAVCIVALYLFAYLTAGFGDKPGRFDKVVCRVALALANVLTVWAFSAEVMTFLSNSENVRSLVLVILWSAYGCLLMLAGAWRGAVAARLGGYGLTAIAIGMALIRLNHTAAAVQRMNSIPVINPSFGGFFVCVIALYLLAYLMAKNSSKLLDAERVVLPLLMVAANALSLFALSSEVLTYVSTGYGKSMGLTLLWAAYGLALVVVGIMGRWRWVRLGGLALVSVAILKLFIIDTFTLQSGYRVAAYLTLGVLLLAGGFVYHRYADVIKGFIMDRPGKGAGSAHR